MSFLYWVINLYIFIFFIVTPCETGNCGNPSPCETGNCGNPSPCETGNCGNPSPCETGNCGDPTVCVPCDQPVCVPCSQGICEDFYRLYPNLPDIDYGSSSFMSHPYFGGQIYHRQFLYCAFPADEPFNLGYFNFWEDYFEKFIRNLVSWCDYYFILFLLISFICFFFIILFPIYKESWWNLKGYKNFILL